MMAVLEQVAYNGGPLLMRARMRRGEASMPSEGSVTHWLGRLRAGDPAAARPLWDAISIG